MPLNFSFIRIANLPGKYNYLVHFLLISPNVAATTPFTIAGCVVEINANVLAAIALAQMKHPGALRGHREVGFTGRGVDGLVYTNSQPYSKRACAFGLRSLSKLLTLSALVKPEKSLFFLERIATKWFDRLTIPSKVEGRHKKNWPQRTQRVLNFLDADYAEKYSHELTRINTDSH